MEHYRELHVDDPGNVPGPRGGGRDRSIRSGRGLGFECGNDSPRDSRSQETMAARVHKRGSEQRQKGNG